MDKSLTLRVNLLPGRVHLRLFHLRLRHPLRTQQFGLEHPRGQSEGSTGPHKIQSWLIKNEALQ